MAMVELIFALIASVQLNTFELQKAHATAYCLNGITASGEMTQEGICAAKSDWLGSDIAIYKRLPQDKVGDLIGIYRVSDTGKTDGLRNGTVVDIWRPDLDSCQEFMNLVYEDNCHGKVYIIFLN